MLVAASLLRRLGKRRCRRMGVLVLLAETAPENLAGELRRHRPEVVLVVDAAELGAPAGTIRILSLVRTAARACTTHGLSLNLLKNYVQADAPARWHIVGIQPASCEFGQPPTPAVRRAAHTVAKALADVLVGCTG
jgi:hydrogenase 3 maturation protease